MHYAQHGPEKLRSVVQRSCSRLLATARPRCCTSWLTSGRRRVAWHSAYVTTLQEALERDPDTLTPSSAPADGALLASAPHPRYPIIAMSTAVLSPGASYLQFWAPSCTCVPHLPRARARARGTRGRAGVAQNGNSNTFPQVPRYMYKCTCTCTGTSSRLHV